MNNSVHVCKIPCLNNKRRYQIISQVCCCAYCFRVSRDMNRVFIAPMSIFISFNSLSFSLYNARVSYFNMVCAQRRINGCCLSWVRSSQAIFYGRPNPVPLLQQCQTLFHFNTHHGKEKGSRFSRRFSKEQE